jgi:hypothetical protein
MTLHASVHSADTSERAMLMQALDCLGPNDVLLLDLPKYNVLIHRCL